MNLKNYMKIKIKNKNLHPAECQGTIALSIKIICRPQKSRETIPLNQIYQRSYSFFLSWIPYFFSCMLCFLNRDIFLLWTPPHQEGRRGSGAGWPATCCGAAISLMTSAWTASWSPGGESSYSAAIQTVNTRDSCFSTQPQLTLEKCSDSTGLEWQHTC